VEQERVVGGLALAEEDLPLAERPSVLLDELARRRVDLLLKVDERVAPDGAACLGSRPALPIVFLSHASTIRPITELEKWAAPWSNRAVRKAREVRATKETSVEIEIDLDGTGKSAVDTPLPFLSHMLDQIARHGLFDLTVKAAGDVEIDGHHTTEDVAIVLGRTVVAALGDKSGIARYGWATLPMDEARASCAIDLSGRTFFVWEVPMPKAKLGTWDTELAEVFFEGFARGSACNLHVTLHAGTNLHHVTEICFKAFAKALRAACAIDPRAQGALPSTKGSL
jgi:imidazoleglycerol-phosphate dehydratase